MFYLLLAIILRTCVSNIMIGNVSYPETLRTADWTGLWAVFELQSSRYQCLAWGSSEQCWAEKDRIFVYY